MEKGIKAEKPKRGRHKRRPSFVWPPPTVVPRCNVCFKPEGVCFCPEIEARTAPVRLLILQHPSEARNPESTARLASLAWRGAEHVIGLSWPSLSKLLEEPANPNDWAVVYLGSLKGSREILKDGNKLVSRSGEVKDLSRLKGLIFIDGNWRQAKTLWWRNPWLNRMNRLVLSPKAPSQYSELRRQPRKECLSTIEAIGQAFDLFTPEDQSQARMETLLNHHLELVRDFKRGQRVKHSEVEATDLGPIEGDGVNPDLGAVDSNHPAC